MRSSKQRSRTKQNRQRPLGNIVNRVFDSSGPEGKVRGTPQQIIDKYLVLARDAQLSNDRVAAENFLQHAEHYTRMLAEAQREAQAEADARRQQQESQQRDQQQREQQRDGQGRDAQGRDAQGRDRYRNNASDTRAQHEQQPAAQVLGDPSDDSESSDDQSILVDTPESRQSSAETPATPAVAEEQPEAPKPRNTRKPRASSAKKAATHPDAQAETQPDQPAAEGAAGSDESPAPRKRAPRKPRTTTRKASDTSTAQDDAATKSDTPKSATG